MPYKKVDLDLATARDRTLIEESFNKPVHAVHVIQLPAGTDASLHLEGPGSDAWPLLNQGLIFKLYGWRKGIHVSNTAGGGILKLGVTFEGGEV